MLLHQGDLLQAGLPDMGELDRRAERDRQARMLVWLRNPMAVRFPLLDPDRALEGVAPVLRAIPGWFAALAWFALIAAGLVLAALHWPELSANVSDRVLTTQNHRHARRALPGEQGAARTRPCLCHQAWRRRGA